MSQRVYCAGLLAAAALILSACAAKQFTAMPMEQPGDDALSCPQITQQMADNTAAEGKFARDDRQIQNGNTAKVVGGAVPFVGPLIVGSVDLSNEEQVKLRALSDRNEHLAFIAKQKGCSQ